MKKLKAFLFVLGFSLLALPGCIIWSIICGEMIWAKFFACMLVIAGFFAYMVKKFWLEIKFFLGWSRGGQRKMDDKKVAEEEKNDGSA